MISKKHNNLLDFRLHICVLICSIIALLIGSKSFTIFNVKIIILPLIYSMVFAIICYIIPNKYITDKQSYEATDVMTITIGVLIAKLTIISGANINYIIQTGPMLLLQELGDIGAIFLTLPVALILGFKRKSIGMSSSICREPQMAMMINKYGAASDEFRGFMIVYITGSIFGTILVSFIATIMPHILPLHPFAYAMACGMGSTSMNVASITTLCSLYPSIAGELYALSAVANIISVVLSVYVFMFISLPLTEKLYSVFMKIKQKSKKVKGIKILRI